MKLKALFVALSVALGGVAHGEYSHRIEAKNILDEYDPAHAAAQAISAAELKNETRLCRYCHGDDGNTKHPAIPSLAGQNPRFLVEQLLVFRDGERYPITMHNLGKKMSPAVMAAVARYFSALPRRAPTSVDTRLAAQGKPLYQSYCAECHGADGRGANPTYAAIQGQMPAYLVLSLTRYRDGSKDRPNHEMRVAARGLSTEEIESIAHYLAGL